MSFTPQLFDTLTQGLDANASKGKGVTFIHSREEEERLSYAALRENALNTLYSLQQKGAKAGDYCVFFLEGNRHFVEMFWACLYGGIIPVPVSNGHLAEHKAKLLKVLAQFDAPWLYIDEHLNEQLREFADKQGLETAAAKQAERTVFTGELDDAGEPTLAEINGDSVAFIQFSSGSTSDPKGVVLTHSNLAIHTRAFAISAGMVEEDVKLSWMPLTHDMGLIGFHIGPVMNNMESLSMRAETFSRHPSLWMDKVSEHKATISSSPNFGYKHYLKYLGDKTPDHLDLSSLKQIFNGAEPISVPLCKEFLERMAPYGLRDSAMYTVYGLAEATLAVAFPEPGSPLSYISIDRSALEPGNQVIEIDENDDNALLFVCEGRAIQDIAFDIQDADGNSMQEGFIGNVCLQGPTVTSGYFNNPEANARTIRNGWLDTGDLGFVKDGLLYITGRAKDIIFSNGLNHYPHDLEALSGIELGKIVFCGVREGNADEDTILAFVHTRPKDQDQLPETITSVKRKINESAGLIVSHVIPVPGIPRTTSGKVQRARLGQAYLTGEFNDVLAQIAALMPDNSGEETAAGNSLEAELKAICDEVIEEATLGMDDNFFDSGISSLSLAQVHEEIDQRYPDKLDITDFFDHPTIREVAAYLDSQL